MVTVREKLDNSNEYTKKAEFLDHTPYNVKTLNRKAGLAKQMDLMNILD